MKLLIMSSNALKINAGTDNSVLLILVGVYEGRVGESVVFFCVVVLGGEVEGIVGFEVVLMFWACGFISSVLTADMLNRGTLGDTEEDASDVVVTKVNFGTILMEETFGGTEGQ